MRHCFCGIAFAIGHHFFYKGFDRKPAPTIFDIYNIAGTEVTHQQANTAIGTAFAFLVRSCLVFAVSSAYLQVVFWSFANNSNSQIKIGHMDVIMSALGNALMLGYAHTWWRRPLLLLIALISWLLPIAAIITPATLSVGVEFPIPRMMQVPHVAFASLNFLSDMTMFMSAPVARDMIYYYNGPGGAVRKVVAATAAQGEILPLDPPAANSSWSLIFDAPSLRCYDLDATARDMVQRNILDYILPPGTPEAMCNNGPGFLSWHPQNLTTASTPADIMPFKRSGLNGTYYFDNPAYTNQRYFGGSESASFFVAATGSLMTQYLCPEDNLTDPTTDISGLYNTSTFLRCDMHNSTYDTTFRFINGSQQVDIDIKEQSGMPMVTIPGVRASTGNYEGYDDAADACERWAEMDLVMASPPCFFNDSLVRILSYQAVLDSYAELVSGMVSRRTTFDFIFNSNSSIDDTVLTQSPELGFLQDYKLWQTPTDSDTFMPDSLMNLTQSWNDSKVMGLSNNPVDQTSRPLRTALEDLFTNITISLLSSPQLQYNESSPFYPDATMVTFSMNENIYIYAAAKLWIAYGLAIAISVCIVALGSFMIWINDASFTNNFSTFLRLVRGAELSTEIRNEDLAGKDPLPRYLEQATIQFKGARKSDLPSSSEHVLSTTQSPVEDVAPGIDVEASHAVAASLRTQDSGSSRLSYVAPLNDDESGHEQECITPNESETFIPSPVAAGPEYSSQDNTNIELTTLPAARHSAEIAHSHSPVARI